MFNVNTAEIQPQSSGVLKEIADVLKQYADVKIVVTGHTDSDGTDNNNLELSKKRADAVKDALVKDYAIDESRIKTDGKGEAEPVSDNSTKAGKAQNRRVVFSKQ